jgi:hypothetical protein
VSNNHLWSRRFGEANDQYGRSVAVAAAGDVVLAGSFFGTVDFGGSPLTSAGSRDIFVTKLGRDTDGDGCIDVNEPLLHPPVDPVNPWDFYSVPVPALIAAPNPAGLVNDSTVGAGEAQAVFAYFKAGAKTGTAAYEQDLNGNGIKDGLEYDRTVAGPGKSGPPDGVIGASDAQLALAQFKLGYHC